MESRLPTDPAGAALASLLDEAAQLLRMNVARIDAARFHVAAARWHLAAGRAAEAWELARAHQELGGHLEPGERSPLGLDRVAHLDRARSILASLGCPVTDPDKVAEPAPGTVAQ